MSTPVEAKIATTTMNAMLTVPAVMITASGRPRCTIR